MQENLQRRPLTTAESLAELRVQHAKLLSAQEQTHARQQLALDVLEVLEARGEVGQRQLAAMAASAQANIDLTPGVTDRLRTAQRRLAQHAESAIPMADLSSASLVQSAPAGAAAQPVSMAAATGSAGPATATAVAPAPIVQQAAQAFAAADAAVAAAAGVAAARSAVPIAAAATAAAAAVAACQSAILPGTVPGMQPSAMYAMPTLAATRFTRIQRHGLGALSRGRGVAAAAVALPTAVSRRVHAAAAPAAAATPDSEPSSRRAVKELVNKVFARKGMDISLVCLISLQLCSILSHTCWSVATSFDCAVCEVKGIRC